MSSQQNIAHYRVSGKIGEGGMGAVYRATDTKLNREVAIKVLPDSFAQDPDRLARFTREAQVLASLNHPNIASIYGVEERAIVMELVEGQSPAGPLSADEALPVIHQLVDALEYAHDKGVIHRDLKPANLKVTPDGRLKVLDFGLAKALSADPGSPSDSVNSPTLTMRATVAGVIMGTAAYMAPEQARGHAVDKRADIWSFGVVVYELLTGRPLFEGESVSDTLAAVLRSEPDFDAVPTRFRRLLRLCLTRDARQRLRDISAARLLLEETAATAAAPAARAKPWAWMAIAAGATLAAAGFGAAWYRTPVAVPRPLMRFDAELTPDGIRSPNSSAILSPDGKRIVFRIRTPEGFMLATRGFDQSTVTVLPGTERAGYAFFSPDSQWLAFFGGGALKKVSLGGGAPTTLCDAREPMGGAWLDNDRIVAVLNGFDLAVLPASGGTPQTILVQSVRSKGGRRAMRFPQALPRNRVLVSSSESGLASGDVGEIVTIQIPGGEMKSVLSGGYGARYVPTGHLLFVRRGTLYGVRFDVTSGTVEGNPVSLQEEVAGNPSIGAGRFDFNSLGTLVYQSGKPLGAEQPLGTMDAQGKAVLTGSLTGTSVRVAPDGQRFAYASNGDLWVYEIARDASTRITFDPAAGNRHPVWSPDGKYLAYSGAGNIWWTRSDGSGKPVEILKSDGLPVPSSMALGDSPRTVRLALHISANAFTQRAIQILPLDLTDPDHPGVGTLELFHDGEGVAVEPALSPDGRWLAYATGGQLSESFGVFVERYVPGKPSGAGGKWQITANNGRFPVWARSGKQLFYRSGDGLLMVVDYTTSGDTFSASRPRVWSPRNIFLTGVYQDYDLFPDGKRALIVSLSEREPNGVGPKATFLVNFFDELKRKLP